jgi:hypothetical protein
MFPGRCQRRISDEARQRRALELQADDAGV